MRMQIANVVTVIVVMRKFLSKNNPIRRKLLFNSILNQSSKLTM